MSAPDNLPYPTRLQAANGCGMQLAVQREGERRAQRGRPGVIEMIGVAKTYPGNVEALRDVSLHIGKGEFVFVVGPSGAGKSTLLRLIYREELPTRGMVVVNGRNVGHLRPREVPLLRRHIGVVFQDFRLLPQRTVYENVAFALRATEVPTRELRRRVPEALELVGMLHRARAFPSQLSGGEQQRVALARAVVGMPAVLVADEPTGNLDPESAWEVLRILQEVNRRGTTVVMVTHARSLVEALPRRVIAIEGGRIVRDEARGHHHARHDSVMALR